jgi:hypothetical protein
MHTRRQYMGRMCSSFQHLSSLAQPNTACFQLTLFAANRQRRRPSSLLERTLQYANVNGTIASSCYCITAKGVSYGLFTHTLIVDKRFQRKVLRSRAQRPSRSKSLVLYTRRNKMLNYVFTETRDTPVQKQNACCVCAKK